MTAVDESITGGEDGGENSYCGDDSEDDGEDGENNDED